MSIFQERADAVLDKWGLRAPAPVLGEDMGVYRRRVLRMIAKRLPGDKPLRRVRYAECDDAALGALEPQLFDAARRAVYDVRFMDSGEMREVVERDDNGMAIKNWVGPDSFVKNPI